MKLCDDLFDTPARTVNIKSGLRTVEVAIPPENADEQKLTESVATAMDIV
jgi:hypothetical protein